MDLKQKYKVIFDLKVRILKIAILIAFNNNCNDDIIHKMTLFYPLKQKHRPIFVPENYYKAIAFYN